MEEATITSKGQVTIPKPIREGLHLETGSKLLFFMDNQEVILKPKSNDPLHALLEVREKAQARGQLLTRQELQEMMKEARRTWSKFQ